MKKTAASLLTVLGLLALPAASQAAETVGNDMGRAQGNSSMIYCGEGVPQCTIIADQIPWTIDAPDEQIITKWSAQQLSRLSAFDREFGAAPGGSG